MKKFVKKHAFIATWIYSSFILLDASCRSSKDIQVVPQSYSPAKLSLTALQLKAIRARQIATIAEEQKRIEIGTVDVLLVQIDQLFMYQDSLYKGVSLQDFSEKYPEVIDDFKEYAQQCYVLPESIFNKLHEVVKKDPEKREINIRKKLSEECFYYKIIGAMPLSGYFQDNIFDIDQAKADAVRAVHNYIDTHHTTVYKKCTGLGLSKKTSKEVWAPGCCDIQMHKSCLKQCQHNDVKNCINPFCQRIEKEPRSEKYTYSRAAWTQGFYEQVLSKQFVVPEKRIRDIECPVCFEALKPVSSFSKVSKKINKFSFRHCLGMCTSEIAVHSET